MDTFEAISRRQSALSFCEKPVETEKIQAVLQAAISAPSPLNLQPWAFVVVTDPPVIKRLAEYLIRVQTETVYGGLLGMPEDFTARMLALYTGLGNAPCFILGCVQPKARLASEADEPILRDFYLLSLGAAMENLMVAAAALDLGTRWFTGFTLLDEGAALREMFGIPDEVEVVAITPLGYYDAPAKTRSDQQMADLAEFTPGHGPALARLFRGRLPLNEVVHSNRW